MAKKKKSKKKINKISKKTTTISVEVDLDAALGNGAREAYLEENPHGFKKVHKVHKNKKKYNRKSSKNY